MHSGHAWAGDNALLRAHRAVPAFRVPCVDSLRGIGVLCHGDQGILVQACYCTLLPLFSVYIVSSSLCIWACRVALTLPSPPSCLQMTVAIRDGALKPVAAGTIMDAWFWGARADDDKKACKQACAPLCTHGDVAGLHSPCSTVYGCRADFSHGLQCHSPALCSHRVL